MSTFQEIGVASWLRDQFKILNVHRPTPVQASCIPEILKGRDVLGCAKTGTGKTIAFAAPILQDLAVDPYGIFALVIAPTRELVFQIADQFAVLGKPINLKTSIITGGRMQIDQAQHLTRRPHIVIASPGRLADHLRSEPDGIGRLFQKIKYLVLDEADQLLDGQYAVDLKQIMDHLPKKRQTLLFSATITSAIKKLKEVSCNKPFFFNEMNETVTADRLQQLYVLTPLGTKDAFVVHVIKTLFVATPNTSIIVFVKTCKQCQTMGMLLKGLGFEAVSLHSGLMQEQRLFALSKFRSAQAKVLVCTDVASRGLDIPQVDVVINYNVPEVPKTYVHRVGRAARADRFGSAITFVTQYDLAELAAIEEHIKVKLAQLPVKEKSVAEDVVNVMVLKREIEIRVDKRWKEVDEKKMTYRKKKLMEQGISDEVIKEILEKKKDKRSKITQKKPKNKKKKVIKKKSKAATAAET
ncbi:unnamed protein product [Bursaphelenchus xylophilus]|uniref:RNA helicase n=1 Tax=Bursaphelenchus xylophilus TaxID=6326 RepID=A0A1I7RKC2_BURXY|nr:unnamed protein product [Bursaphelenchus xylophilus]CAG9131385.1 unnamed protein product [Bursaphelenchus xylophilus]